MSDEIDLGVRTFIAEHIQSVAQLELILLLHSNPHQPWRAADAAREFGLSPEMALGLLRGLCQQGFASASDEACPSAFTTSISNGDDGSGATGLSTHW